MRSGAAILLSAAVLCLIAVLFVFHPFIPNFPFAGIDPSWEAVVGEAADRPARWGIDTVFTYGPASPLVTGYYNAGYFTRTLPLQLGFIVLFGWCAALLIADGNTDGDRKSRGRRVVVATAACGLMVMATHGVLDAFYFALPFLVFLLAPLRPGPAVFGAVTIATALGAFAMGLTAMVKMSFPLAALPLFLLADAVEVTRRRWPRLLPCFTLGVLTGAPLYGQSLADLPTYAAMQGEVVAGYAAAMAIAGSGWDLLAFLTLSAGLMTVTVMAGRHRPAQDATVWLVPLGLAIEVLFLFKAGFIRHDLHSLTAWSGLCLVGTALAWARMPSRTAIAVTAAACVVVLVYMPILTVRQSVRTGRMEALSNLYRAWLVEAPRNEIAAAVDWLRDPAAVRANLDAVKAQAWADIASAEPLPRLVGTVDVIPSQQSRLMAAGLAYHARPSFQEYSTYTPGLENANRAFIQGPDAPRWMLFGSEMPIGGMALDGRYPGFAEGALWPDLMRLYRPDHRIGALVALERRAAPAPLPMGSPHEVKVGFGDFTPVPAGDAIWSSLDVRLNLAGHALSALFRPPLMTLGVRLADGTERWFRFVPGLADAGFVLSPLVDNASDFEALAAGRAAGGGGRVTAVAVQTSRFGRLFYAPDITLTLRTIDTSGLAAGGPATRTPTTAWDALAGATAPADDGRIAVPLPSGPALGAASTNLPLWRLPVVDGRRAVALTYGLADAEAGAAPTASACFTIRPADGIGEVLWHRCLDPAAGDAGPRSVTLAIPASVTELVLEAACAAAECGSSVAYWAKPPDEEAAH